MPYRLLLADDSLTIQKVVELTFSDPEYELLAVGNGEKALDAVDAFQPDIVLADVVMPGPPGYDICEAVRKRPGGQFVPVVLLTGTFEPFDRARADRVGATAVVTKPFDSHALAALVKDLLLKAAGEKASAPPPAPSPAPAPAPAEDLSAAGDDTMTLADAPAPGWGSRQESAAADLFPGEPATPDQHEPPELYATSAIPISAYATLVPSSAPASEGTAPPPAAFVHLPPPPPPAEPVAYVPPPPPPAEAGAMPFEREPLPPPPPFEPGPAAEPAADGWEIAAATASPAEIPWEDVAAEPVTEEKVPVLEVEETTRPLAALEPPAWPFETSDRETAASTPFELPERTDALDMESASTQTQIILPPPEREPVPPLELAPPPPPEPVAEMPAETLPEMPALAIEEAAAFAEPEPETRDEEIFDAETMAMAPITAPVIPERELPDLGHDEPVARDIEEDMAAFENSQSHRTVSSPQELETLAANASLTDLIPAAAAPVAAAGGPLSDADVERVARLVVELIGEKVVRDIAWEVVPELAERCIRERLAEIEKE